MRRRTVVSNPWPWWIVAGVCLLAAACGSTEPQSSEPPEQCRLFGMVIEDREDVDKYQECLSEFADPSSPQGAG